MASIPSIDPEVAQVFQNTIDKAKPQLSELNLDIHSHPELNFNEHHAHDALVSFLTGFGFSVTPSAYGIPTSLTAEHGSGGRLVVFNAEYDALPEIGHACGHNLIATASVAGFLATAAALKVTGLPGRARLIGTPAEEGGCGKGMLISKGAYEDVDACVMAHPAPLYDGYGSGYNGRVSVPQVAATQFNVSFKGKNSHAAAAPWLGTNALDAIVLGYNAVSMLRQQIIASDRIHGIITDGGLRNNIIPGRASVNYGVRSATIEGLKSLQDRVINCFKAGAIASGCEMEVEELCTYANLQPNKLLGKLFSKGMEDLCLPMFCAEDTKELILGATDQGNVSCVVPAIHPIYGIETDEDQYNHTVGFTIAAATQSAFERTLKVGNGLARTAWLVLRDDAVATAMKAEFDGMVSNRRKLIPAEAEFALLTSYDKAVFSNAIEPQKNPIFCSCARS